MSLREPSSRTGSSPMARSTGEKRTPPWLHFAAGGAGGMCGAIITSPLDVVKTRLQSDLYRGRATLAAERPGFMGVLVRAALQFVDTSRLLVDIARREGTSALFKGLGPTLVGVIPARSINFYTYGNGKRIIAEHWHGGAESSMVHLSAAAIAGIITSTATNPIWVVKTRLQLESQLREAQNQAARQAAVGQVRTSSPTQHATPSAAGRTPDVPQRCLSTATLPRARFFQAQPPPQHPSTNALRMTLDIFRNEGIRGFYKGLSASYLGVSESTIQWVLYERLKHWQRRDEQLTWFQTVSSAGTAKMVATIITYPHEVIRTRLRQQPENGIRKYTNLVQTFRLVLREEGAASFYGGLSAHLMRVIPNAVVTFSIYEFVLMLGSSM